MSQANFFTLSRTHAIYNVQVVRKENVPKTKSTNSKPAKEYNMKMKERIEESAGLCLLEMKLRKK